MPITQVPQFTLVPSMDRPGTFAVEANQTVSEWPAIITAQNAQATEVNALATAVNEQSQQVADAAAIVNALKWVSGENVAEGLLRWSPSDGMVYRHRETGVSVIDPAADADPATGHWWMIASIKKSGNFPITLTATAASNLTLPASGILHAGWEEEDRNSNTILGVTDHSKIVNITGGTFTQTFTAAATLKNRWNCIIKNSGTGVITLDFNGIELCDGVQTITVYPGEVRLIQCSGTAFSSVVLQGFCQTFSTTGNFYMPPGYKGLHLDLVSGGGGGSVGASIMYPGGGGGGGARLLLTVAPPLVNSTTVVTVGAGGAGSTSGTAGGGVGGTTGFGTLTNSWLITGGSGGGSAASGPGYGGTGGYALGFTTASGIGWTGGIGATSSYGGAAMFGGGGGGMGSQYAAGGSMFGGSGGGGGGGSSAGMGAGGVSGTYTHGYTIGAIDGANGADGSGLICGSGGGGGRAAVNGGNGGFPGGGGGGGAIGTYAGGNGGNGWCRITGVV